MLTLTELCQFLRNWFTEDQDKHIGMISITGGEITARDDLIYTEKHITPAPGQYFRVVGSIFSDGVHQYPDTEMPDEAFKGAVWLMKIPPEIIVLANEIEAWKGKYMGLNSPAMSPYNSESFAGYSYSKSGSGAGASTSANGLSGWKAAFADRLDPWRKI